MAKENYSKYEMNGVLKVLPLAMYHFIKVIQNAPCYFLIITK